MKPSLTISCCYARVKSTDYNIIHAYGIGFVISERSVGSTDVVAMEFIPLKSKTLKSKILKYNLSLLSVCFMKYHHTGSITSLLLLPVLQKRIISFIIRRIPC